MPPALAVGIVTLGFAKWLIALIRREEQTSFSDHLPARIQLLMAMMLFGLGLVLGVLVEQGLR